MVYVITAAQPAYVNAIHVMEKTSKRKAKLMPVNMKSLDLVQ